LIKKKCAEDFFYVFHAAVLGAEPADILISVNSPSVPEVSVATSFLSRNLWQYETSCTYKFEYLHIAGNYSFVRFDVFTSRRVVWYIVTDVSEERVGSF
jgi:hypothetical protein